MIATNSQQDILIFPNETWCYRHELSHMTHAGAKEKFDMKESTNVHP